MKQWTLILAAAIVLALAAPSPALAADGGKDWLQEPITVGGRHFATRAEYYASDFFRLSGNRCGTPDPEIRALLYGVVEGGSGADCGASSTNPDPLYDPGARIHIPVVVHIIMNGACTQGDIADDVVQSQIDILNEDFLAILGTNGENGTDAQVRFDLARLDPVGDPTTGITRTCNETWWFDDGNYWDTLAWDPNRYLNIYTNNNPFLGYVPFLPADGGGIFVGTNEDRVVVLWSAFGRNSPFPPYDLGRTATHEVGHYFGLEHPFSGSCGVATPPGCYSSGDLICDTNPDASPHFGCPVGATSCGAFLSPIDNYMEYSDDLCMERFTLEQSRRMRCTVEFWRPNIDDSAMFSDDFESGDLSAWSTIVP